MANKITNESIHKLHLIAAGLYGVMTLVILLLSKSVTVPLTTSYLTVDQLASSGGGEVLATATRHLFDLRVSYLVAAVLVIAGLTHLAQAYRWRKVYEAGLDKRLNIIRWLGWGTATALAVATMGMLAGISDKGTLLMVFTLIALTFYANHLHELRAQQTGQLSRFAFVLSLVTYVVPWLVIGFYVKDAVFFGRSHVPSYLYLPLAVAFLVMGAMLSLIYQSVAHRNKAPFKDYLFVDRSFIFGSFARHTIFALAVFFGVLR